MMPEQKILLVHIVGTVVLIAGYAALEYARMDYIDGSDDSSSSDEDDSDADDEHSRSIIVPRKRPNKSVPSSKHDDRRKSRHISESSDGEGLSEVVDDAVRRGREALNTALDEFVLTLAPSTDLEGASTYAAAFEALENKGLSEHDLGDAFDLYVEDPRVPRRYMAIRGEAPRRRFLQERLAIYHTKKCNDGKSG